MVNGPLTVALRAQKEKPRRVSSGVGSNRSSGRGWNGRMGTLDRSNPVCHSDGALSDGELFVNNSLPPTTGTFKPRHLAAGLANSLRPTAAECKLATISSSEPALG